MITQDRSASCDHSFTGALTVVQALIALLADKAGGKAINSFADADKELSRQRLLVAGAKLKSPNANEPRDSQKPELPAASRDSR